MEDGTAHGDPDPATARPAERRTPSGWDIARVAGVSQSTVSRVMNRDPRISAPTRARVEEAMQRLGYRPNAAARTLTTGRSHLVGLIVSNITNPFYPELIETIVAATAEHDCTVVLCNTQEREDRQLAMLELLIGQQVDGVILSSPLRNSAQTIDRLGLDRVPLVTVNRRMRGQRHDAVHLDNARAGRVVAEHLLGLGHDRIGFVGGLRSASTNADRLRGVRDTLRRRGRPLSPELVVDGEFTWEHGYAAAAALLERPDPPTALICADDLLALGVIDAAADRGLDVPGDVAVVGFDDIRAASLRSVALTTVRQPVTEMGRRAVDLLMARITGVAGADPVDVVLPPDLVVRRTCGAQPGRRAGQRGGQRAGQRPGHGLGSVASGSTGR